MERRINQSNELYLIEDEDLKRLLDRNPNLKKEVEETEKLINTKLKIKTIEEFDEIVGKIKKLELAEDEAKSTEKGIQDLVNEYNKKIEEIIKTKENELMTV